MKAHFLEKKGERKKEAQERTREDNIPEENIRNKSPKNT